MSDRHLAWRNLMVAGINAGIDQGHFTLESTGKAYSPKFEATYEFEFLGLPALGNARDIGWDELSIKVALVPGPRSREFVHSFFGYVAKAAAGEAFASGWLERQKGRWLQQSNRRGVIRGGFYCRRSLVGWLARALVEPQGYADRSPT